MAWSRFLMLVAAASALIAAGGSAHAQACYESSIMSPTPFMGNDSEIFRLSDGSVWEVRYEYSYLYEYYPRVVICPSRGRLLIKGKSLNVALVTPPPASAVIPPKAPVGATPSTNAPSSDIIDSRIDGEFSGWEGETIFRLANGQIWQQSSYAYTYSYKYSPKVLIYRRGGAYEMQVEGVSGKINVVRLK